MRPQLQELAQKIQAIGTSPCGSMDGPPFLATGWPAIDEELGGGLARSAIHEWLGQAACGNSRWFPSMAILAHLARQAIQQQPESGGTVVWVGRPCWPSPFHLFTSSPLLQPFSIFLDPPDEASRLWVIDLALRSPAVAIVVADGSGLQMAHTRRLQLAAESGSAIGLLARSPQDSNVISAARTRWQVSTEGGTKARRHEGTKIVFHSVPSCLRAFVPPLAFDISTFRRFDVSRAPRWRIELLRCKGVRPAAARTMNNRSWVVEYDHAKNRLDLSPHVADRPDPAAGRISAVGSRERLSA